MAAEIARIAPALRRAFPDIPPPIELPAELARRYVWNSFSEFMGRAAQRQPLLLVLEDLHWAGESTVLLTEYLAPLLPDMPVLVLGTYRDDEVDLNHPLARVIGQLSRRRLMEQVSLHRLSFDGVRAMLRALAGQPAPEQLAQVIDRETEGNPFFVEEVYLHLVESGVLLDQLGRMRADLRLEEVSVPESIRLVLGQRLGHLAASTREVLIAAAVFGRVFASELVGEVADASRTRWSRPSTKRSEPGSSHPAGSAGELMFSHELIRQTLLSGVSAVKRERLHLRASEAISRRYSDDLEAHAGDLAYHLSHAGRCRRQGKPGALPDDRGRPGLRRSRVRRRRRALRARACRLSLSVMQLGRAAASRAAGDGTPQRGPLGGRAAHDERGAGPLRGARAGGGHWQVGLGHGVPAHLERPADRGGGGLPTSDGGTRRHRERRQGPPALCAGTGAQCQRRLRRGSGHVRSGARAC